MSALTKLTTVEAKLFAREPLAMFWGLIFPPSSWSRWAFFPGFDTPSADLGGYRMIDLYAPIVLGLALATLAFATLPAILATYRERGVLRRLQTTPVSPWRLVAAQLIIQMVLAGLSAALAIAVGVVVFDIPVPENLAGSSWSTYSPQSRCWPSACSSGRSLQPFSSGQGIGMAVYFPMLFFAGVYFPREAMSDGLLAISDMTPTGAGVQALQDTWSGLAPSTSSLLVMAAFAIGAGVLAALAFRWE